MKLTKILRAGVAGVLIASVPVSASSAATRPGTAVPVASSAAVAAAQVNPEYRARPAIAWPAVAVIVGALALAVWIAIDDDDDGEGAVSRA